MPRHPLTIILQRAFEAALQNGKARKQRHVNDESRRKFIRNAALAAAGTVLVPPFIQAMPLETAHKIAIIGGGIAGLNAAWQLKKLGIEATIYEASDRTGGRMFTMTGYFGEGLTTDIGGEFVDLTHKDIIGLVEELGLDFWDLRKDTLEPMVFHFGGQRLTEADLSKALEPYVLQMVKDIESLPEERSYATAEAFRHLDNQSILAYIRSIGMSGWLYDFINVVLTGEYGMEASEQSAINFLIMFTAPENGDGKYRMFGDEHEVLKIRGGSQALTNALTTKLSKQVMYSHKLVKLEEGPEGQYRLHFEGKGKSKQVVADHVILALPFSVLRSIELKVEMPEGKRKCINEQGYGTSCKFIMGMKAKPWREQHFQGYTFTDGFFGSGWDSTHQQSLDKGSFSVFGGGEFAEKVYATKVGPLAETVLQTADKVFPGIASAYSGNPIKYCWGKNPFSKAGYSSFKVGQWSTLAGWEAQPVGNILFAGEHVSSEFQGYMNGAAQTGRLAAWAIAEKIGVIKATIKD